MNICRLHPSPQRRRTAVVWLLFLLLAGTAQTATVPPVQTVFVIVLENNNWASFKGSASGSTAMWSKARRIGNRKR